jgi:uncharacterized protein YbjT (DUF2867 family)
MTDNTLTLVLGGTGKTGRRVARRLTGRGEQVRIGSRAGGVPFHWENQATWGPALGGVKAAYVSYYPDLAAPGAAETVGAFAERAVSLGVRRLVLLSGRGEEEAEAAEKALQAAGADWTVLRCAWFAQNFSEDFLLDSVLTGNVVLPAGDVGEPFVDADDIAEVAATVLTEPGHEGQTYELTGPRLLTFAAAVADIAAAVGRPVAYQQVPVDDYTAEARRQGVPEGVAWLLTYLFGTVLDGRNASLGDGVERVLGRPAKDFADYARDAAAAGAWTPSGTENQNTGSEGRDVR